MGPAMDRRFLLHPSSLDPRVPHRLEHEILKVEAESTASEAGTILSRSTLPSGFRENVAYIGPELAVPPPRQEGVVRASGCGN